ncbi:MAG: restriction endonuclease subunit S [Proteobacteria bacterium]|nr:restriction endonuclease subunit S [Pseudomonadota bacterium]
MSTLNTISTIQSGFQSRTNIRPEEDGSHGLIQIRDLDPDTLILKNSTMIRFNPILSRKDWELKDGDILFMARGGRNFSVLMRDIPGGVLASGCFFIIRLTSPRVLHDYLCWYLNQEPVSQYVKRKTGRGVHMPVVKRSVLEAIDIPIPSKDIQKKIIELNRLMNKEQALLVSLAEKRKQMITHACLNSVNHE